jgi:Putative transposase of IS4/5 family (DUF4096)
MATLVDDLVPDELWAIVQPLLPAPPRPPYGGRHRAIPDRNCFAAIVYMARSSTPWRLLPARELGCGESGRRSQIHGPRRMYALQPLVTSLVGRWSVWPPSVSERYGRGTPACLAAAFGLIQHLHRKERNGL